MFGFCSASAPQKQDLQKSTLHNTQLCDIFNPSAFGYGKCHITCVMYKPLRLWLRGSTFLQKLRPIDRLCRRSLVLRLVAPTARALLVRPPLQRSARPPFGRSFSAFPPPPDRLCRRSTCGGVGYGANDRPSASAFGWVALLRFAPLRSLGSVLSPLSLRPCQKRKLQKAFAFHNFFSDKLLILQQIILFLRYK